MSTTFIFKLMPHPSGTVNRKQLTFDKIKSSVKCQVSSVQRKAKGFTLIELLVVIAIIGILASFAIASFTSAQAKGRDSRRKADVDAIKKALELFHSDTTGAAFYPQGMGTPTGSTLTTPGFIRAYPSDPSSATLFYTYTASGGICTAGNNLVSNANCTSYSLVACLENANDPQRDGTDTCAAATTVSYTITNP